MRERDMGQTDKLVGSRARTHALMHARKKGDKTEGQKEGRK